MLRILRLRTQSKRKGARYDAAKTLPVRFKIFFKTFARSCLRAWCLRTIAPRRLNQWYWLERHGWQRQMEYLGELGQYGAIHRGFR